MDAITQHHYHNIAYGKSVENDDGTLTTVDTIIVGIDGVETLIPTVWDGEIVDDKTAIEFAIKSGVEWPTRTGEDAVEELEAFDRDIHTEFTDQTSQEEALQILVTEFGYPETGTEMSVDGGTLTLGNDTFENGSPVWTYIEDENPESLMAPPTSIRPESRPTEAEQKEAFYLEKDDLVAEEYNKLPKKEIKLAENEFAVGGLATARKGITTEEGKDMANKKYQRDDKEADTNEDGMLSPREKEIADAIQKNEIVEMSHGGMMSGLMGYDEVSGNPIPIGASPENVRDDIDAKLSTDEYVMPAHVVKWHGLKQIQMMQAEAEMGLMSMKMDGLIQSEDTPEAEEEEIEEPDEGIDVEVAMIEVDDKLDDSDEIKKILPRTSDMPLMQKNKYAFAV
tara:strand:- start:1036 stop:2220 length:1185 start_codon:yes stop_codon:yes gene_type:complete